MRTKKKQASLIAPLPWGRTNLVPRVLSYPPFGARERERSLSLSPSEGRVGENSGNEVGVGQEYWQSLSYLPSAARAGSEKIKANEWDGKTQEMPKA